MFKHACSQSMRACVYERQDWTIRVMSCVKGHHLHWFLPVSTYLHMQPFCYLHICKYTQACSPGDVRTGTHTSNDFLCPTWDAFKLFTSLLFGFNMRFHTCRFEYARLKGKLTTKNENLVYLLSLILFQTHMAFYFLLNTKMLEQNEIFSRIQQTFKLQNGQKAP